MNVELTNEQMSTVKASLLYSRFQIQNEIRIMKEANEKPSLIQEQIDELEIINQLVVKFTKPPTF